MSKFIELTNLRTSTKYLLATSNIREVDINGNITLIKGPDYAPKETYEEIKVMLMPSEEEFDFNDPKCGYCGSGDMSYFDGYLECRYCGWTNYK